MKISRPAARMPQSYWLTDFGSKPPAPDDDAPHCPGGGGGVPPGGGGGGGGGVPPGGGGGGGGWNVMAFSSSRFLGTSQQKLSLGGRARNDEHAPCGGVRPSFADTATPPRR